MVLMVLIVGLVAGLAFLTGLGCGCCRTAAASQKRLLMMSQYLLMGAATAILMLILVLRGTALMHKIAIFCHHLAHVVRVLRRGWGVLVPTDTRGFEVV